MSAQEGSKTKTLEQSMVYTPPRGEGGQKRNHLAGQGFDPLGDIPQPLGIGIRQHRDKQANVRLDRHPYVDVQELPDVFATPRRVHLRHLLQSLHSEHQALELPN